jgi:hypothetical protein
MELFYKNNNILYIKMGEYNKLEDKINILEQNNKIKDISINNLESKIENIEEQIKINDEKITFLEKENKIKDIKINDLEKKCLFLKSENTNLRNKMKELKKNNETLDKDNKIKDVKIENLDCAVKELKGEIMELKFEKIFRDYMMTTAESVILFEINILKEVYGDDYNKKEINYKFLLDSISNNKLTPEQLNRFNEINNNYKLDFDNGIFKLNEYLEILKEDRNYFSHDYFKSTKLSIQDLEDKMNNFIKYSDNEEIENNYDDFKFVIDLIIKNLKEKNGEYPFANKVKLQGRKKNV